MAVHAVECTSTPTLPMVTHVTHQWTHLDTGEIQRRCLCGRFETEWVRDTPENRRILQRRANDHITEEASSGQTQTADQPQRQP